MITLTHNINAVIAQLERLRADIPKAVERALAWEKWIERAGEVAEATLNGLSTPDEQRWVRPFVEAIQGFVLHGQVGFGLKLASPLPRLRSLLNEAVAARATGATAAEAMTGLFGRSIRELEEAILEWVQTEKDKDERDLGKSDEEIARLLTYVLIAPDLGPAGVQARQGLMRHIVPWLQREQESAAGLPPETVDLWLRAVLAAWTAMVRAEVVGRIRAELKSKKFP
jgi:hypothetical protein